jgi:hypothetical protein
MFSSGSDPSSLDNVTHVIQVALTPIFLLSGIAALLNVFSTRLGRVADRVDQLASKLQNNPMTQTTDLSSDFAYLRRRSFILDVAVVLGAMGGVGNMRIRSRLVRWSVAQCIRRLRPVQSLWVCFTLHHCRSRSLRGRDDNG